MKLKFNVIGMSCTACSSNIEKTVSKLKGVSKVQVNLLKNNMVVEFNEDVINEKEIIKAVQKIGYDANLDKELKQINNTKSMKKRVIISFVFLIPLMYVAMGHMINLPIPKILHDNKLIFSITQLILVLPIVYVNRKYYKSGFKALIKRAPNMDSLIAIGSLASIIYGIFAIYMINKGINSKDLELIHTYSMNLYFESAGMILTLITFGKYLETKSKEKTSNAINKLLDLAPKQVNILKNGEEILIPVEKVKLDDIVIIKPGETIAVDGIVTKGSTHIDESSITGEHIPVKKEIGDKVISGTINKYGSIEFKVEKVLEDTTLSQIIKLVEEASSSKAPIGKLADKVSGIFVPIVILIAIIAFIIWIILGYSFEFALSIGISVLVISCPCALGLATPVSVMVGTGKAAENGILIKSAESLEIAHLIDTVVLDKTGTITNGKPELSSIYSFCDLKENELLEIAGGLESKSEHPIGTAILEKIKKENINIKHVKDFEAISGKGIKAKIDNKIYYAGNEKLMNEQNINILDKKDVYEELYKKANTVVFVSNEEKLIGIIGVSDIIKASSKNAIDEFRKLKIETYMLTGDNKAQAQAIANEVGIENVVAEVLPQDKERKVRELQEQGRKVAMIGDGINDAPALTRADLGIAIGAGTDIAIESADIVLIKSDLTDAVYSIDLSKAVIKNIKMNLFWAFFYNTIGIPLACGILYPGFGILLNPMIAAFAMSLSSVCVVTNALRLRTFKKKGERKNMKKEIYVKGMMCDHCKNRVKQELLKIKGVYDVRIDLKTGKVELDLSEDINNEVLKAKIEELGYEFIK